MPASATSWSPPTSRWPTAASRKVPACWHPPGGRSRPSSIGNDLATRNLLTELRDTGQIRGGGRPFGKQDRSRFLGALDNLIQAVRRTGR